MSRQPEHLAEEPRRFYVFYFDSPLEGEQALARAQERGVPHRLQKFYSTAYAGAISLGRGWGRIYVPEGALRDFMEANHNQLAPEPELYVEAESRSKNGEGLLARLGGFWRKLLAGS